MIPRWLMSCSRYGAYLFTVPTDPLNKHEEPVHEDYSPERCH